MESYFFADWEPVLHDALLVAAAVEYCDRIKRRPAQGWGRQIELRVPVHECDRWNAKNVADALHTTLDFLTGDQWHISFYARRKPEVRPRQINLSFGNDVAAVIPFSDGLDSCAVAGLFGRELGDHLVRVRLGSSAFARSGVKQERQPFTSVPYRVQPGDAPFVETSARSRGFRFSLLSGLAAYLSRAERIIIPESGQGALGSALVPVGQGYEDFRSHPLFMARMEVFIEALLGHPVHFDFPQIWKTKGETLAEYVRQCEEGSTAWVGTCSCWQQSRQTGIHGRKRQCGICAACMLRRLSVHAAGLHEPADTYVWEDLGASTFESGAAVEFDRRRITGAMREYAIAGTLHLDHLAGLRDSHANLQTIESCAFQLGKTLCLPEPESRSRLDRLLKQHATEWRSFMNSLGPDSFVADWAIEARP
jgi:hypothetical protein